MKILIIGNGAREHVIAETLKRSSHKPEIHTYASSKNPGLVGLSSSYEVGSYKDFDKLKAFALKVKPDFAFIGPEAPIADGVTDMLEEIGIKSVAPCKILGALESSKSFARDILGKYSIPGNPEFKVFYKPEGVKDFIQHLDGNYVVKADGLKGGKGVKVSGDHLKTLDEGIAYALECLNSDGKVVIEEKFIGQEFSLMAFVDGKTVVSMPPVQDHKRAYDGDKGPNCYCENTEILTNSGWKKFRDLNISDNVMVFDPKTKVLRYERPEKIYFKPYKGTMFYFRNRNIDLLVTPNHRMLLEQRKGNRKKFIIEAKDYKGEHNILLTGKWTGTDLKHYELPEFDYKFNRKISGKKIPFKDWTNFLAIFLAEGYVSKEKIGGWRVYICQTAKSMHLSKIKKILDKLPYPASYDKHNSKFRINSTQLAKCLVGFGNSHNKFVPSYVKEASPKIILGFLKSFCIGDGDMHYGKMRFHSSSKKLIDDIQELVFKLGYSSVITEDKRKSMTNPITKKVYPVTYPVYSLEMNSKSKSSIRKGLGHYGSVNYNGHVGCVTVSTGFIVVRKNNRIAISGNTGGMGSYGCEDHLLPFLRESDVSEAHAINVAVADALYKETGKYYKGIMYGGFIAVRDGVRLIEYNVRFGDPEAMNVLPILKTDFVDVCLAIINGTLADLKVEFEKKATVCKYLVPDGYPDNPCKDKKIEMVGVIPPEVKTYYASVDQREDGLYLSGSRAIAFVGIANTLEEASAIATSALGTVKGPVFYRKDIGTKELIQKRIDHMKELRD